jgi:hypothetical protein
VPAQVGSVLGHDHYVGRAGDNFLLAAGADVGLAGLGGVDTPDLEAQWLARGRQVRNLLQL